MALVYAYLLMTPVSFIIVDDPIASAERLNADVIKILKWAETLLVAFNPNKPESLIIS